MFANTRPLDGLHTVHIGLGPLAQMLALWADTPVLVAAYDHTDTLRYANAAFVQAYRAQEGQTWAELMRANHCTREGAQPSMPTRDELGRALAQGGVGAGLPAGGPGI